MFFKQRIPNDASISFFFGCGGLKAVAVDVRAGDEAWHLEQAKALNAAITMVFDTHVHADHLSGGRTLARLAGADYLLHESNLGKTAYRFAPVAHRMLLAAGNTRIEVLHTPGHTEDGICLLVTDRRHGDAPWFVLTGDTLFVGSVGCPDLAGRAQEMAALLWDTLHERLLALPADLEIFAGHTGGSTCGADMPGKPSSTIGFERRWNPLLSLGKTGFIARLTASIPVRPADRDRIVATNLGHAEYA